MKALQIIIIVSMTTIFSLHSMIIIPRKTLPHLPLVTKINNSSFQYCSTNKKTKTLLEKTVLNRNVVASTINVAATVASGSPLFLLPMIPQILYEVSKHSCPQSGEQIPLEKDLKLFMQTKKTIIKEMETINEKIQEINPLKNKFALTCYDFLDPDHQNKVDKLVKDNINLNNNLSKITLTFFKTYKNTDLLQYLEDNKNYINLYKQYKILTNVCLFTSLPFAYMPWSVTTPNGNIILALLILFEQCVISFGIIEKLPHPAGLLAVSSLILSTGIIYKNFIHLEKAEKKCQILDFATEILKNRQAQKLIESTNKNQINE
ncbi:MAG TPA: hypothetical protein VLB80_02280 [Candidatus Babeliales bacterium]|nr:hypothetical protein [Candidatus Babeliales bacterium]